MKTKKVLRHPKQARLNTLKCRRKWLCLVFACFSVVSVVIGLAALCVAGYGAWQLLGSVNITSNAFKTTSLVMVRFTLVFVICLVITLFLRKIIDREWFEMKKLNDEIAKEDD